MSRAFSLLELICILAISAILMAVAIPSVLSTTKHAKAWIYGVFNHKENQITAFLVDADTFPQQFWLTNKVRPWFK